METDRIHVTGQLEVCPSLYWLTIMKLQSACLFKLVQHYKISPHICDRFIADNTRNIDIRLCYRNSVFHWNVAI